MIGPARHGELIANGNDANSGFARLGYVVMEERYAPAHRAVAIIKMEDRS
jgi:uncharacterized protein (UPF0248 family)